MIVSDYGLPRDDVRFIASILSIPCEERYGAVTMTPQKFQDETLRALVDTVEAAARKQPSLMLFEDAHWADPSSLDALDLLVDRVGRIPLLMVLTHRPEFQSRWSHYSHVTALTLTKLTRAQSNALVQRLTGGKAMPANLLEQILSKTNGVPLFVEELTRSILESAGLQDAGDRYIHIGAAHTLAIPLTLRDSLMSRLDRFMPVKEVAQIGAAIGHSFSYELLAAVAPHAKPDLDQALSQLIASGLAFRHGTPPDEHFPTTEETEPEVLAHHYMEAKQPEKAILFWHKAALQALARSAMIEAVAMLRQGLNVLAGVPDGPRRQQQELDLRIALRPALAATGGFVTADVIENIARAQARLSTSIDLSTLCP